MATVASRLQQLTGLSGVTMAQYLQALAAGSTVAAVLAAHSGLTGATMAQHLLVDVAAPEEEAPTGSVPDFSAPGSGRRWIERQRRRRRRRDEELHMIGVV